MGGAGGGAISPPPPPESGPEMGYDQFICPSHTSSILGSPEFPPFTRKISECLLLHTILHFCISSQNVVLLRQACRYQYFCMTFVVSLSLFPQKQSQSILPPFLILTDCAGTCITVQYLGTILCCLIVHVE